MSATAAVAAVAAAVVAGLAARDRRRATVGADAWPWLVAEIEGGVLRGGDPAAAAVRACLGGPPALVAATALTVAALPADTDGATVLLRLADATADPRVARLYEAVAPERDPSDGSPGADAAGRLRLLRHREHAAAAAHRTRAAAAAPGVAARWFLLAPLVPVAAGALPSPLAAVTAAFAVAAWSLAGRWLRGGVEAGQVGRW